MSEDKDPNEFQSLTKFIEAFHSFDELPLNGEFETLEENGSWCPIKHLDHFALTIWKNHRVRRKPQTINILGHELPLPMQDRPKNSQKYYVTGPTQVFLERWNGTPIDGDRFLVANCFATRQDAQAWFDFQVKLRKGEIV